MTVKEIIIVRLIQLKEIVGVTLFVTLFSLAYLLKEISKKVYFLKPLGEKFEGFARKLDGSNKDGDKLNRVYLIELAYANMKIKKTRTLVTIGGIALGIAFIVLLVSIGYGLQNLVVTRVARLDELKQTEVMPGLSKEFNLNDEVIAKLKGVENVEEVLPVISVVGRINFNGSVSDVAVYGVTSEYLKKSAIQPIEGEIFDNSEQASVQKGEVAGSNTDEGVVREGDELGEVEFNIEPDTWVRVRDAAGVGGTLLGYTRRIEVTMNGDEVFGSYYAGAEGSAIDEDGRQLGRWIMTRVRLWEKRSCEQGEGGCEEGMYVPIMEDDNSQRMVDGYIAEIGVILRKRRGEVLAASTSLLPTVDLASASALIGTNVEKVTISESAVREIVVNRSLLKLLGVNENEAVGQELELGFVAVGGSTEDPDKRIESDPAKFKIVAVTPDESTPIGFIPFIVLRKVGISNYSQLKVIVKDKDVLSKTRSTIEAIGYGTISVADTVSQIDNIFSGLRWVLAALGSIALGVASLGMFNTLTVSLLERTREVGLMKAMGMRSQEVKELFLTESIIMGLMGGIIGLLLGFISGKLIGMLLSILSLTRGGGLLDVSAVPVVFILVVLGISLFVGVMTGLYPARRAMRISALDALRYE